MLPGYHLTNTIRRFNLKNYISDRPALILLISAILFVLLGYNENGINIDSTTYSVISRNMIELGCWFNPTYTHYYHPNFAEHPPLVMWAQAIIFLLLGASDITARFFGYLTTVGSVMIVYYLAKEIKGKYYGFLSGLILLLSYNFMQNGKSTMLDVPLSFFILVSLWGIVKLQNNIRIRGIYYILGAALGMAFLTKGVVSAPIWIAFILTSIFIRPDWLKERKFWLISLIGVGLILVFLILDWVYANSHFVKYYFVVHIWRSLKGTGVENKAEWYRFIYQFCRLYIPFILLLPFGIYLVIKRHVTLLYPTLICFVFYLLFHSMAGKLYYHYFCPVYALAAPLAALPLTYVLSENTIRKISVWFFILWILLAGAVSLSDIRINQIRSPEIYHLNETMNKLLINHPSREGLLIGVGSPEWDYVAKTSWYWRSDIRQVMDFEEAVRLLATENRYIYIMANIKDKLNDKQLSEYQLQTYAENDRLIIYIPVANSDL